MPISFTNHWGDPPPGERLCLLADARGAALLDVSGDRALLFDQPPWVRNVAYDVSGAATFDLYVPGTQGRRRPIVTPEDALQNFYALNRISIPEILAHLHYRMEARAQA
jgi:hypothetical protein